MAVGRPGCAGGPGTGAGEPGVPVGVVAGVIGATGFNASGAPKKVAYDPSKDTTFPKEMSISGNRAPIWTDARDAFIFGIAKLTKVERPAGRGGAGAGNAAPEASAGGDNTSNDEANSDRPNLTIWSS